MQKLVCAPITPTSTFIESFLKIYFNASQLRHRKHSLGFCFFSYASCSKLTSFYHFVIFSKQIRFYNLNRNAIFSFKEKFFLLKRSHLGHNMVVFSIN